LGLDGYIVVGFLCKDPSLLGLVPQPDPRLLGLALPPDQMMMGLGAQKALVAVGPTEAAPTKVGPCFHQTQQQDLLLLGIADSRT